MAQIKQLDKSTLNRICGGQVVVDLSGAVKELVENAIDAGATSVDLRLRESGADSIEVSDNGRGIPTTEFAAVTRKSCTSKISTFEDVYKVVSFGFRGEALSALCELSSGFEVVTRTSTDATATHIVYNRDGSIRLQRPAARPPGTTVTVTGLFSPLPVRHREFMRALKKQYGTMMSLLQAFALVSKAVRFTVTNTHTGHTKDASGGSGPEKLLASRAAAWVAPTDAAMTPPPRASAIQRVLSTSGSGSLRDVVGELFGADFMSSLIEVDIELPDATMGRGAQRAASSAAASYTTAAAADATASDEPPAADVGAELPPCDVRSTAGATEDAVAAADEASVGEKTRYKPRVSGLVSRAGTGVGRSNNEKQFLFINGRPVDLPRVIKALNEVWRQYEMAHKPAAVLNFQLAPGAFDINVSPDKREVLLVGEGALLDALKTGLHALWEPSRRTFHVLQVPVAGSGAQVELTSTGGVRIMAAPAAKRKAATQPPPTTQSRREAVQELQERSASRRMQGVSGNGADIVNGGGNEQCESCKVEPTAAAAAAATAAAGAATSSLKSAAIASSESVSDAVDTATLDAVVDITPSEDSVNIERCAAEEGADITVPSTPAICVPKRRRSHPGPLLDAVGSSVHRQGVDTSGARKERLDCTWMRAWFASPIATGFFSAEFSDTPSRAGLFSKIDSRGADKTGAGKTGAGETGALDRVPAGPGTAAASAASPCEHEQTRAMDRDDGEAVRADPVESDSSVSGELDDVAGVRGKAVGSTAVSLATCAANATNPDARELLEREYSRVLNKQHFTAMSAPAALIGQFNKGFILAALGSDVFLLDQHACDEKFNFERLVRTTSIHTQQLLVPRPIDLTASEEATVLANEAAFAAHGFHFMQTPEAPPGRRLRLTTVPFSKAVQFGDEDVRELASLLADAALSGSAALAAVRLPKAVAMHASRACRSSIMIGTSLTRQVMRRVVGNLAELDQPWNCPHGRPTLRHLVDLSQLARSEKVCPAAGALSTVVLQAVRDSEASRACASGGDAVPEPGTATQASTGTS